MALLLGGAEMLVRGAALVAGVVLYTGWSLRRSRREAVAARGSSGTSPDAEGARPPRGGEPRPGRDVLLVLAGLAVLVLGSGWLVDGATAVARGAGVSEAVVGLTVVAAGTSLPEVATCVVAGLRG